MARQNNYGSHTWSRATISGTVFGPAGPLAVRTTYSVTEHSCLYACTSLLFVETTLKSDLLTIASYRKDVE